MDVKSLYPRLDIAFTIQIVCDEFIKSDVKVEGVDYDEVGLYIKINRNEEYVRMLFRN